MTHREIRSRNVRVKFKDLLVVQAVLEEVDLEVGELKTKERIDLLIAKMLEKRRVVGKQD